MGGERTDGWTDGRTDMTRSVTRRIGTGKRAGRIELNQAGRFELNEAWNEHGERNCSFRLLPKQAPAAACRLPRGLQPGASSVVDVSVIFREARALGSFHLRLSHWARHWEGKKDTQCHTSYIAAASNLGCLVPSRPRPRPHPHP